MELGDPHLAPSGSPLRFESETALVAVSFAPIVAPHCNRSPQT